MFQTITANPLLIKQGLYVCMTQVDAKDKSKKRYVLLGSTDLTAMTFESKDKFEAAVQAVVDGQTPEPEVVTQENTGDVAVVADEVEENEETVIDET